MTFILDWRLGVFAGRICGSLSSEQFSIACVYGCQPCKVLRPDSASDQSAGSGPPRGALGAGHLAAPADNATLMAKSAYSPAV
jgi:hypothetical protein